VMCGLLNYFDLLLQLLLSFEPLTLSLQLNYVNDEISRCYGQRIYLLACRYVLLRTESFYLLTFVKAGHFCYCFD